MRDGQGKGTSANALVRGLLVLECFSPERDRLSLAQLAGALTVPKSSLFRVVKALAGMDYLRYDERSKTYSLGVRVLSLGFSVLQSMELREIARPYLEKLTRQFNKTVNLAILDKHHMVYVERVKVPGYRDFNIGIGSRIPAWNTAVGKAVLANLKPVRLRELMGKFRELPEFNAGGGEERLARHIKEVRKDGFAINDQESLKWIRAIAVPVFSPEGVACAINIVVEAEEVSVDELRNRYARELLDAGKELSRALGYRD